jgi:preprotein translocase subunit SecD
MKTKILTLILVLFISNIYSQKNENSKFKFKNGWYEIDHTDSGISLADMKTGKIFFLKPEPIVSLKNFNSHEEFENYQGSKGISIKLDKTGTENWRIATKNSIGNELVFVLENEIFCIQLVNSEITAGICAFWKVQQTKDEWKKLERILN